MELMNQKVKHFSLGLGTVIDQAENYVIIKFPTKISKFIYPGAFTQFLECEDTSIQSAILQEIVDAKSVEEEQKRVLEEAQRRIEEQQAAAGAAKKAVVRLVSSQKKSTAKQERIPGKRMTFYVFQGNTFDQESRSGYIWAPISNKAGQTIHHWERLMDVKPGDIILHGCDGYVQATSIAKSGCYDYEQPKELRSEELWENKGRRVDCDYILIKNPIKTNDFVDDILRLCSVKYAPFDRNGNGNMGYLFELNRELACIFLRATIKYNTYMEDIDYIKELLMETEDA